MLPTLSKTDFQLASSCAKKLVYKKAYYPTANDTNEYMEMLAQGGYVVGRMATMLFPNGVEIEGPTHACLQQTQTLMAQEEVVLFESAFQSSQKLVRVDILEKKGNQLHIIEVKAKSFDSDEPDAPQKLKKYIEDVAYQYAVVSELYPNHSIRCSLLMPDKSKRTSIEHLAGWFSIAKAKKAFESEVEELPAQQRPSFNKPEVVFKYENDPSRAHYVDVLAKEGILGYQEVTAVVKEMQPDIRARAQNFLRILNEGIAPSDYQICKGCKSCEFNTPAAAKNGYVECWGDLAYREHHIFDLYYGGAIGSKKEGFYLDELIAAKKVGLFEMDPERLQKNGAVSVRAQRQLLQLSKTKANEAWKSPELAGVLNGLAYPLHFIDFETYTGALPFFKGMRPYELIAFQWSCHTIQRPGASPTHAEWIHTSDDFPNFEFARALMRHIGYTGTPLMWATHENTVLRTILNQMKDFEVKDEALEQWLLGITKDKAEGRAGRFVDMNKLTLDHYFHPYMKGRTSIKKVLPAIWNHHDYLHEVPHFSRYAAKNLVDGMVLDPYDTLSSGRSESDANEEAVVSGGTAAMRAYYRIRFDTSLSPAQRDEIKRQLLEYCKLDTMAMVIIAHHWGLR
ncbi:MAG: DUF2779 domain-containing protein [Sphingobacteriaceae bacterium]|nr:DUF2779 domain-containing protein [Sphingobacteriaceae bacterium]